ncbi:MAG TPA: HEAT repeat domain-containing protein [Ktedonobacteraceae bacterium]|nr:HEAT repeat domain-containing protein [Ktedonobacteraceae bacterium]
MPATNNIESILLTLRKDYPMASGRQAEKLWKETIAALVNLESSAVQPLIATLHDRDRAIRKACVQALGKLADPRALPALISMLEDRARSVRRAAAEALGDLSDPHAIQPLVKTLQDEDAQVRSSAAKALSKLGWQPANQAQQALFAVANADWESVVKLGKVAEEPLKVASRDEDAVIRHEATKALQRLSHSHHS